MDVKAEVELLIRENFPLHVNDDGSLDRNEVVAVMVLLHKMERDVREACAKVAEDHARRCAFHGDSMGDRAAAHIAQCIREGGHHA